MLDTDSLLRGFECIGKGGCYPDDLVSFASSLITLFLYAAMLGMIFFLLRASIPLFGRVHSALRKRHEKQPPRPRLKLVPTAKDKRRPRRRWMPSHLATLPIPAASPQHNLDTLPIPASPRLPDVDQLPRPA